MSNCTLFTYNDSVRGYKCLIAAEYSGLKLKTVELKTNDTKTPDNVPYLTSDDKKTKLINSNAIAYYVANEDLRGLSVEDRAFIIQWMTYGSTDIESAVASWVYPAMSFVESTPKLIAQAKTDLKNVFSLLNDHLKERTYMVGERITLADICVACDLLLAYKYVACETFRKAYVNVNRWFQTMVNQAQFKTVLGETELCTKPLEFDAAKHASYKKPVQEKPAKEPKKPAEKKPAEKKPVAKEEAEEEEEDYLAEEPKQNDPFAEMPKGTFNMDEFKRVYSNNDTTTVAIPYFWQHFEKDFYSIWMCEYKYPEELSLTFMSSNLVGGMFQRIEKLRKNSFASMCIFGENNDNTIVGIWFWKGHELVFPLCKDWTTDYESYIWTKLDPDSETTKQLVNQFYLWEGEFKGKKFNCGKIFK